LTSLIGRLPDPGMPILNAFVTNIPNQMMPVQTVPGGLPDIIFFIIIILIFNVTNSIFGCHTVSRVMMSVTVNKCENKFKQ
jgi:hypothetical protein